MRKETLSIETIIARIEDEVKLTATDHHNGTPATTASFLVSQAIQNRQAGKPKLDLIQMLDLEGEMFIHTAYMRILKRPPDQEGTLYYSQLLTKGRIGKIEIAGGLRYSPEGRDEGVIIPQLFFRYLYSKLVKIPVLGGLTLIAYRQLLPGSISRRIIRKFLFIVNHFRFFRGQR